MNLPISKEGYLSAFEKRTTFGVRESKNIQCDFYFRADTKGNCIA